MNLGNLVWWNVTDPGLRTSDLERHLVRLGISTPAPKPAAPIDAYRRLAATVEEYPLQPGATVTLNLHQAPAPQKNMMLKDVVRTVKVDGVIKAAHKVGDAAFYKPPQGQAHRARVKVTIFPEDTPDRARVAAFGDRLRNEYDRILHHLDGQGIRRYVRRFLKDNHALYLQGPYFVPDEQPTRQLEELLGRLDGCSCESVALPEGPRERNLLTRHLLNVTSSDEQTPAMLQRYHMLGLPVDSPSPIPEEVPRAPDPD